jgi:multidrug efflux pump subunit AcrA (membrane-fusion protein)
MKQKTFASKHAVHALLLLFAFGIFFAACTGGHKEDTKADARKGIVSSGGRVITFAEGSPGLAQIQTTEARRGRATISAFAPARIVASISTSVETNDKIVLFESPDITSLYSSYRQAKQNAERTAKNLARVRDMFANQGVTAADVTNAESDAATARTTVGEMEVRLRTMGFNPVELERATSNSIWLICDVPENELAEVQKGEEVDVVFSSIPEKKFIGRANAVGDVIDPMTRTVKVRVTLANPGGKLRCGMFARVDFGDPQDGLMLLPNSALIAIEEKTYVFVETKPHQFERREVIVKNTNTGDVVVLKGLESGEHVVTAGAVLLKGLSFGF